MRLYCLALLAASLCACSSLVYKLPTRQGNVIEQKEIDKLQLGMTRDQVRFVMGTPMAATALQADRWDYLGYYKNPRGKTFSRTVSLYFEGDKLARMEGTAPPAKDGPEVQADAAADEQKAADAERATEPETGVVITPE